MNSFLLCHKHQVKKECMGGRSAHISNWYCPECEKETRSNQSHPETKESEISLREEIAEIYRERSVMDLTKADEIINKVLDKAVEAAYREMIPTGLHKSHDLAIEKVVLAIRRLKND